MGQIVGIVEGPLNSCALNGTKHHVARVLKPHVSKLVKMAINRFPVIKCDFETKRYGHIEHYIHYIHILQMEGKNKSAQNF